MAATVLPASQERKGWLERLLSYAAEVRPGEVPTTLLLSLNVFLLMAAYLVIRPVRSALILTGGGAEVESYTGAATAGLFMFIVPAYGAFASRVNRIRLINWVTVLFASNFVVFFFLGRAGVPVGIPFYIWASVFNLVVVAQIWSFANDLYSEEQGKRLFAIVGFAGNMGAVAGAYAAGKLIKLIGLFPILLVSAGILLLSLLLTNLIHSREKNPGRGSAGRPQADQPLSADGGFQLVLRHRYLLLIGLMTFTVQYLNTNGNYILNRTVSEVARQTVASASAGGLSEKDIVAAFFADFLFYQNILVAFITLFLVSRIFKHLGIARALFIMPAISMLGYGLLAIAPLLPLIRINKILENAADYSLQNTARRALFLLTSREAKYKALQAVETFFWRCGDMFHGLTTLLLVATLGLGVRHYAFFNLALVAVWILLAARITREHRKLSADA